MKPQMLPNNKANKVTKVALYLRVSTAEMQDTAMQRQDLLGVCAAKGYEITEIYEDKGYTGTNTRRPGLTKLRQDAKSKKFDALLIWSFDRFARSLAELILMIRELNDSNVKMISFKDSIDLTTPHGMFMMHIMGAFAEFECSMIRMRVQAGMDNAKANGTKSGNPIGRLKYVNDSKIVSLRQSGYTVPMIVTEMKVSRATVYRALQAAT